MVMTEKERLLTAYHESGHAIVGLLVEGNDPVYKVTIMPRGHALGVTMFLPDQDRYSISLQQIEGRLASLFGGRCAEELIFGKDQVTTGASNDIEKATEMARSLVTRWGLDRNLGPICYTGGDDDGYPGKMGRGRDFSEKTAERIDQAVSEIIDRNYKKCMELLKQNIDKLHAMAKALMLYETIDEKQLSAVMEGRAIPAPKGWKLTVGPEDKDGDK
jgi:cell division protease FtsH